MKVDKIKVVLRVCSSIMQCNASRQMQEYGMFEKLDVIKRTAGPLYKALRRYVDATKKTVEVIVILDNCVPAVELVHAHFSNQFGIPVKFEKYFKPVGNAGTFRRQCEIVKTFGDSEIAFFLEDDYLTVDMELFIVMDLMFENYDVDGVNPHWHPRGGVSRKSPVLDSIEINKIRFGRIDNSCCTFAVKSQIVKENEGMFLNYCARCRENDSFNNVWKEKRFYGVYDGTMMEHLHQCDLSGVFDLGVPLRK